METTDKKKLKTGSGAAEKRNVTKPRTATVGHNLKNAKLINRRVKKIHTEEKRYHDKANAALRQAENTTEDSVMKPVEQDVAARQKKISYKLSNDYRPTNKKVRFIVADVRFGIYRNFTRFRIDYKAAGKKVRTAVLHTAVVGGRKIKTGVEYASRGILRTAETVTVQTLKNSDDETLKATGYMLKTGGRGVKTAKTAIQTGQRTVKTAAGAITSYGIRKGFIPPPWKIQRMRRDAAKAIKEKGLKRIISDAASSAKKAAAQALAKTQKIANDIIKKLALPVIIAIGAMMTMSAIAVPIAYIKSLLPFDYIYELIDGLWEKKAVEYPADAINIYISIERKIITDANKMINGFFSGESADGNSDPSPMDRVDRDKWDHGGNGAYMQWLVDEFVRNQHGEYTEFDYTPYEKAYPNYMIDDHGNIMTTTSDGTPLNGDGSVEPDLTPQFMGGKWSETTDSEGIPELYLTEFLAVHCAERAVRGTEADLMPEDITNAFLSYDLWQISSWQEHYNCPGCVTYTYWAEVTYTNDDGTEYTTMERFTSLICRGHYYNVVDVQLDNYSVEAVQKKLWEYDSELDPDGDGTDDNGNTKKTLKEGKSLYKDVLKEINEELKNAEKAKKKGK
jgi:hypothetical protein